MVGVFFCIFAGRKPNICEKNEEESHDMQNKAAFSCLVDYSIVFKGNGSALTCRNTKFVFAFVQLTLKGV